MGYCPLVVQCCPLADLHHFRLTKGFPKTHSSIQPMGAPSVFCIHYVVPGFVVYHLNQKTIILTNSAAHPLTKSMFCVLRIAAIISYYRPDQQYSKLFCALSKQIKTIRSGLDAVLYYVLYPAQSWATPFCSRYTAAQLLFQT